MKMLKFLGNEKVMLFVGGAVAAMVGAKVAKNGKTYKMCVKGLAAGMDLQKRALETFQNMKEDAEDLLSAENNDVAENG
jgi:hypothetical protein